MSKQTINIGASPNDGTGTPLRTSFDYTNQNFTELYTALGGGVGLPGATTQVIFNDGGTNLAGDAGLVYNKTTDTLTAGNATITGAATVGTTLGVTGVSTFAAGTAALPALTTTGDTNTGIYYPAADTFAVTIGGTERYRVDSSGNLGIGVTPSAWTGGVKALDMGSGGLGLFSNGGITVNAFFDNTDSRWEYKTNGPATFYNLQTGVHQWFVAASGLANAQVTNNFATAAMELNASGNLAFPTGKGIDFSAVTGGTGTATANVLNDYEEGTFTPGITFGGASVAMTGSFSGRYTKVGRAVTVSGIITLTAKGSSTGNAKLTGLPFTSANAAGGFTAVCLRLDRVSFTDVPCGYLGQNVTAVELENITNAGTVSNLTDANFINSSVLIWNFTYTV